MGFLQCYWDYCSENQQQWQQVEDSRRASFCFGLFVGHMDRKIQFTLQFQDENALRTLFNAPLMVRTHAHIMRSALSLHAQ
jgi:hypothetical protein